MTDIRAAARAMMGAAVLSIAAACPACLAADSAPLRIVADVPLTGDASRFDYQSVDPAGHRLFISHMGAGSVIVFDMAARREVAELPGFPGATGVTVAPSLHRAFVSITGGLLGGLFGGGRIAAIDTQTLTTVWTVSAGRFPDGSALVGGTDRLFVSDESGGRELVIDARTGKLLAAIPLGGEAGMTAFDAKSGRVYVNVQTAGQLAAIDPVTNSIASRYSLPAVCSNNHGLLIDAVARRSYIACDGNAKLLVFDLSASRVVQTLSTGDEPDVLALDAGRGRLYVAGENGMVTIFDSNAKEVVRLGEMFVGENAHSIAVEPQTGLIYLPLPGRGGHPVLRIMEYVAR